MMRVKRFVLDCNIWISYIITNQQEKIVSIISDNNIVVFGCDELYTEIQRVLKYKHLNKYKINIREAIKFIKTVTVHYEIAKPYKRYIPTDENDDYVIALALQTSSGFIKSGDNDILLEKKNLKNY